MVIIELEVLVQTTPLCGSWFYETVWRDYIANGGVHTDTSAHGISYMALVPCFSTFSDSELEFETSHGYPWRGLMLLFVGILEGLLIGLVYSEVFTCFAVYIAKLKNKRLWQDHERMVINFTYPFEAGATVFYFLILAFVFVPNSMWIQGYLAENSRPLTINLNASQPLQISARVSSGNASGVLEPCHGWRNGRCDEWSGACLAGTDTPDCTSWGCTDPNAINYNNTASRTLPWEDLTSLYGTVAPADAVCRYNTSLVDGGGGAAITTTCPSANDGKCDEPVRCFIVSMVSPDWLAEDTLQECIQGNTSPTNSATAAQLSTCALGSDVADCRLTWAELLQACLAGTPPTPTSSCLTLLRSQHFSYPRNTTAMESCVALLGSSMATSSVCTAFQVAWPAVTSETLSPRLSGLVASTRCRTANAQACVADCGPCVACLIAPTAANGSAPNTSFCVEYHLCTHCIKACTPYASCFPAQMRNAAMADGASACARMGRVGDGLCSEQRGESACEGSLAAWACPEGEDSVDCTASFGGAGPTNAGCRFKSPGSSVLETTVRDMMLIWVWDKRYKNQINQMILVPMVLSLLAPMLFEYLLPLACSSWQRSNRQAKRKGGLWCRCCCSICHCCRCCVLMWNCFLCDDDQGTRRKPRLPAFPDELDDDELARLISEEVRGAHIRCTSARQNVDKDGLQRADAIIVESMLDPLDLPNEYRKICIINLFVGMWTIVMPYLPVAAWIICLMRWKFNFVRLTKYSRRPIPKKPTGRDATGGYRPWLQGQLFASTLVTTGLFCFSTGQLEAWWSLWDAQSCSPPSHERSAWKYPSCASLPQSQVLPS
jgi:hypothetical protein